MVRINQLISEWEDFSKFSTVSDIIINKMSYEGQNQYFQDYSLFSHDSNQRYTVNRPFSVQHSFFPDINSSFCLDYSDNHYLQLPHKSANQITQPNTKPIPTKTVEPLPQPQHPTQQIKFETQVFLKYKEVYKGSKDDTVELNINFKTVLCNFFKQMIHANELNEFQIKQAKQFMQRVPSFSSLHALFKNNNKNHGIRRFCLQFFTSAQCVRKVMGSRCKLKTKLQMIKYIQKLRLNIISGGTIIKWKDVIKNHTVYHQY